MPFQKEGILNSNVFYFLTNSMMKKLLLTILPLFISLVMLAQERTYWPYYYQRTTLFEVLPVTPEDIIFLGNSITDGAEWAELFNDRRVKNRGISGDTAYGVYDRLDAITSGKPAKIFLLIGTNDMAQAVPADSIVNRIGMITQKIKADSPATQLYIQSILPVNNHFNMFTGHTFRGDVVKEINKGLIALAAREGVHFVDLFSHFTEADSDKMDIRYTNDGLHLNGEGYLKWVEVVKPLLEE